MSLKSAFRFVAILVPSLLFVFVLTLPYSSARLSLILQGHPFARVVPLRRFTSWNDIATIRPFSLLGLKYLRLDSRSNGTTAHLSRFLSRKSEFKQTLLRLAPPGHPIRAYFA